MTLRADVVATARWIDGEVATAAMLPANLRRRTSPATRATVEVIGRLAERAAINLGDVTIVHGSALGEIGITVELLEALAAGAPLSPTKFHNSVHNTAMGYVSIATGNRGRSTSLAAGGATTAMVLLEALCLLAAGEPEVLAVVAESGLPDAFAGGDAVYGGLAVAMLLRRGGGMMQILGPVPGDGARDPVPDAIVGNPCAPAWSFAARIEDRRAGRVGLAVGNDPWSIEIRGGAS